MDRPSGWLNGPMLITSMSTAKIGKEIIRCCQVSSPSHHSSTPAGSGDRPDLGSPMSVGSYSQRQMGLRTATAICLGMAMLWAAACDPLSGTGPGPPPDPKAYIHSDQTKHAVVITLIAGYPAGDYQFNYNGYRNGTLVISVPVGWQATIQCENHATVPNSCAVVAGRNDLAPMEAGWWPPDPSRGLDPGGSATFAFTPSRAGSYRIASLVGGSEASGMWADLEVTTTGVPAMRAEG